MKVTVKPSLLRWARERAALEPSELAKRVGLKRDKIIAWERTGELDLKHLERLAAKTNTPVGYLFLPNPPTDLLPVADFRRPSADEERQPSPELLDTVYICQRRQEWYRDWLVSAGEDPLWFVGRATLEDDPATVGGEIREAIRLDEEPNSGHPTWEAALNALYARVEELGVLVMRNGVVGNNTHRQLDVGEFRGFALCDRHAPLIFVNAADSKSGQMFTLLHELAHIWIGQSGVSDADPTNETASERFCNLVAAETLVPADEFRRLWNPAADAKEETQRLARYYKVSSLVVLIRARYTEVIDEPTFERLYREEVSAQRAAKKGSGGDFYRTQGVRVSNRFAAAVIGSALEGRTPYKDAYRLLGIKKASTFDETARKLGFRA